MPVFYFLRGHVEIAIFGAGVAGLTVALSLCAKGQSCRIYERSRQSLDAGMGFILMPDALGRLRALDVGLCGVPLYRYRCSNTMGTPMLDQPMPHGARGIRRREFIAALLEALPLPIEFGSPLAQLDFAPDGRVTAAYLASGTRIEADLYVAADGSRSLARNAIFPTWSETPAQVIEIVGLARCDRTTRWAGQVLNKFQADSGGLAFGILPVDTDHVVWYLQFDAMRFTPPPDNAQARRAFVMELVGGWAQPIPQLLAITDFSQVHLWRPLNMDLIPRFHQGNLVLAGDAAHPFLPFSSQGVSSAIADAMALADALIDGGNLAEALAGYSDTRRHQCESYIAQGRQLTQNFLAHQVLGSVLLPFAK